MRLTDVVEVGVRLPADIGQSDLRDGGKPERLLPLVVCEHVRTASILLRPVDPIALLHGEDEIDRLGGC